MKRTSGRRCRREREVAEKSRRQLGEEDEVRPESQIRQPEPNPIPSVGPKPMFHTAQTPRPFTRESAHHRARPVTRVRPETRERPESQIRQPEPNPIPSIGPKPMFHTAQTPRPFTRESAHHRARPVTRVRLETRERPVNLRLDPRFLHMRRSLIVPRGTSTARLLSAPAAYLA